MCPKLLVSDVTDFLADQLNIQVKRREKKSANRKHITKTAFTCRKN
jgi:hypothetical protein